ncbi:hypothetical protein LLEC1_06026, partial [Akanthomyces lecanii]
PTWFVNSLYNYYSIADPWPGKPARTPAESPAVPYNQQRAVVVMNKSLQDINIQNMNVELVAQMFKNYQSNVLFHLEGERILGLFCCNIFTDLVSATDNLKPPS